MIDFTKERTKSLQDLLRDKQKIIEYMKLVADKIWIDTNKYKWTNEFKMKEIKSLTLPIDFPALIYKLLDIVELYITVKKYSDENIIPTDEEIMLLKTIQSCLEESSYWKSQSNLNSNNQ